MPPNVITYILNTGSDLVGKKWRGAIIWCLQNGPLRFTEIQHHLPDISTKMLSQILKEMENNMLIVRTQYNTIPVRVEYEINPEAVDMIKASLLALHLFATHLSKNHVALNVPADNLKHIDEWLTKYPPSKSPTDK